METETESRKGKWSSQQYVYITSYQCQDRSSSSKSRSASLGRCKTWTLDWTHELTDIWTPCKAINDDMTHIPCIQPCPSSVQCTSGGFGELWLFIQYIKRLSTEYSYHPFSQARPRLC